MDYLPEISSLTQRKPNPATHMEDTSRYRNVYTTYIKDRVVHVYTTCIKDRVVHIYTTCIKDRVVHVLT